MQYLIIGIILILALIAIRVSSKHGIPSLLLFIVLGIVFGSIGMEFNDYVFADGFATVALMLIMFYGGFGTNWNMVKPVAKEAIVLSSLGVVATALLTGLFCHYVLGFAMLEGMLIGSIVGSTDYASVSNILRSKNLNLKHNTAPLLELESGSNDPTAYTMTMIFLSIIIGSELSLPLLIISQIFIGLAVGFILAWLIGELLIRINLQIDGLYAVFMAASMLITFALSDILGGNGYLSLYILGIYLGNKEFQGKRDIVFFFDGLTEIMQIGLFFLLGLLSNLPDFVRALPVSAAIMVFMMLLARPLTVYGLMLPFRMKRRQLNMISLAGVRGAAAIAFAIMAVNSRATFAVDIYHIVFGICVLSSLIQGSLMPVGARRWDMLDPSDTVLKTFNYYLDKANLGFLETRIKPGSKHVGTKVKDLNMEFEFIVAKIERDGKTIIPRGEVVFEENDIVVLGGETHFDKSGQDLIEFTIPEKHDWVGASIKDLDLPNDRLLIMVQRKDSDLILPDGYTQLLANDKVVLIQLQKDDELVDVEPPEDPEPPEQD